MLTVLPTFHAPGESLPLAEIQRLEADLRQNPSLLELLDQHPTPTILLTPTRQIVYSNQSFRRLTKQGAAPVAGLRIGEALQCRKLDAAPSGCGTGEACRECGAIRTIIESLKHSTSTNNDCRFSGKDFGLNADFLFTAYPMTLGRDLLTVVALQDVSAEKRRAALERTFFHDVLNTASGLQGLSSLINDGDLPIEEHDSYNHEIEQLANSLIEEIQHHRKLMMAERGELIIELVRTPLYELLRDVESICKTHPVAFKRRLRLTNPRDIVIQTDIVLLRRVVTNLVKNALEATPEGGTVSFQAEQAGEGNIRISVHNAGVIPRSVQLQIFERSFSTKSGSGRGVGTYSVKLFTEQFLKGHVNFTSDPIGGTIFTVTLPQSISA